MRRKLSGVSSIKGLLSAMKGARRRAVSDREDLGYEAEVRFESDHPLTFTVWRRDSSHTMSVEEGVALGLNGPALRRCVEGGWYPNTNH